MTTYAFNPFTQKLDITGTTIPAPVDAQYLTLSTNGTLTQERVFTPVANQILGTDNGAGGTYTLGLTDGISIGSTFKATTPPSNGLLIEGNILHGATSFTQNAVYEMAKTYTVTAAGQYYGKFVGISTNPASASSSTIAALGFVVAAGGSQNQTSVNGLYAVAQHGGSGTLTQLAGAIFLSTLESSGNATTLYGVSMSTGINGTGNASTGIGFQLAPPTYTSSGRIDTNVGLLILNQGHSGQTFSTGIYIDAQSGSTTNYSIFINGAAAYTPTNVTTDRSYDADSTTLDEIADVLGTLIADLQTIGLIG